MKKFFIFRKSLNLMEDFYPIFWFHSLFGCDENITEIKNNFQVETSNNHVKIKNTSNGKTFYCGSLFIKNYNLFRQQKPRGGGKLNIICGSGEFSYPPYYTDFISAQNHPEFEGATFQIESSAMCTQNADSNTSQMNGITDYAFDSIQGAVGSVATAPATFYRNYTCSTHINLLSDTPFELKNGYARLKYDEDLENLENLNFDWDNLKHYKIGIQRNNDVYIRRDPYTYSKFCINEKTPKVHQVFCVRFDFIKDMVSCPFTKKITKNIYEAQYRMSILAAWENSILFPDFPGSKILFLVPLGAEVGSSRRSIAEALSACTDLIIESGLEVYLSCPNQQIFSKCLEILQNDIEKTGGKVIKTKRVEHDDLSELDSCDCCKKCSFSSSVMWIFAILFTIIFVFLFKSYYAKYILKKDVGSQRTTDL